MDITSYPVLINGDRDEQCFYVRTYHGHPKQRNSHILIHHQGLRHGSKACTGRPARHQRNQQKCSARELPTGFSPWASSASTSPLK